MVYIQSFDVFWQKFKKEKKAFSRNIQGKNEVSSSSEEDEVGDSSLIEGEIQEADNKLKVSSIRGGVGIGKFKKKYFLAFVQIPLQIYVLGHHILCVRMDIGFSLVRYVS